MSLISTVTAIAGRIDLAASLLFGGGAAVTLGAFEFVDMETPEQITFGGTQQLTVHKFPGGARVIDAMGRDDVALQWSGIFINDADTRARELDEMRVSGIAFPLTWRDFSYLVVIRDFQADTRAFHSPYRITCEVLQDLSAGEDGAEPSVLQQVAADINSAVGFNLTGGAVALMSQAQTAIGVAAALTGGSPAALQIQGYLGAAQIAGNLTRAVAGSSVLANVIPTTLNPLAAISGVSDAVSQSGIVAQMSAASGFIGRSLANATQGAH